MKRFVAMFGQGVAVTLMMLVFPTAQVCTAFAAEKVLVTEGEIRQFLTEYVRNRSVSQGVEVVIKGMDYRGDMALPAGKVDLEVIAPRHWEGWGSANIALIVRVNERLERNLSIRVDVEAFADMVVSLRPLERGEIIGRGDVALQRRDLARVSGRICRTLEEVLGKRVRSGIGGNTPLRVDYLEKVPIVKSGQIVTIVAENENLRITARGKTKNSGAEGETVLVQQLGSQREIPASVVNAGTVKVEF